MFPCVLHTSSPAGLLLLLRRGGRAPTRRLMVQSSACDGCSHNRVFSHQNKFPSERLGHNTTSSAWIKLCFLTPNIREHNSFLFTVSAEQLLLFLPLRLHTCRCLPTTDGGGGGGDNDTWIRHTSCFSEIWQDKVTLRLSTVGTFGIKTVTFTWSLFPYYAAAEHSSKVWWRYGDYHTMEVGHHSLSHQAIHWPALCICCVTTV